MRAKAEDYIAVILVALVIGLVAFEYFSSQNNTAPPVPPGPPGPSGPEPQGLWAEIVEVGETAWQLMQPYVENGMVPHIDERTGSVSRDGWPDTILLVYLYLVTGEEQYLDIACQGLQYAADNLINENGVMMLYDFQTHRRSATETMPSGSYRDGLATYLAASCYILELRPAMKPYVKKLADAALKFQGPANLYAMELNPDGSFKDPTDSKWSRAIADWLLRIYQFTGDTRYLNSALKMIDSLWSYRKSNNLIDERHNVITGEEAFHGIKASTYATFVSQLFHAYRVTGNRKYYDWFQIAKQTLYDVFWKGDHWAYRASIDCWEMRGPSFIVDNWAMGIYVQEGIIDIRKRIIQGGELSSLNLIYHASDGNGHPVYNSNDDTYAQMSSLQAAWGYSYLTGDDAGYVKAVELFRAYVKYHRKTHGFVQGVDANTGGFYRNYPRLYEVHLSQALAACWHSVLLLLQPHDIVLDFGEGFPMPYRYGEPFEPPWISLDKFCVNLKEHYIKITVRSGQGTIEFQVDSNIVSCRKNGFSYTKFTNEVLNIDGPGTYEVWF